MNKLEKSKIDEITKSLYQVNLYMGINYIGMKKEMPVSEQLKLNNEIARCIRQLKNLQ